jgi:nitrite reductase (NADH) small subunit
MTRQVVCAASDLPPGASEVVTIGKIEVAVINVEGRLYALRNTCPHRGAPLCRGKVGGTMVGSRPGEYVYDLDGLILRCPWHRYEFDLRDGRSLFDADKMRVKTYPVAFEGDSVVIDA